MWLICAIALAIFLCMAVIVFRAACFVPKKSSDCPADEIQFDKHAPVEALQRLIQCQTISCSDSSLEDDDEFEKLISLIPQLYPQVIESCSFHRFPERGILMRWPGKSQRSPSVMMAHYDVVPADASQWDKPPFSGIIEDGILWGRGTLDTKATFNGILCAANHLICAGFQPENDIYFAFSGSEEINGNGAKNIVDYFIANGIQPALVLDEGGAVVENVFPGVKSPCALIGIAEKGQMNVQYSVTSNGGHASAPPVKTPVDTLCKACRKVVRHPFKMRISQPAAQLFDTLGRHSTFGYKLIFSNLWCFRPVLDLFCRISGGELNALVRTTTAFTQMQGSDAKNVLPTQAKMISNIRLNPGDTVNEATERLQKIISDPQVSISVSEAFEASSVSKTDCGAYDAVASAISQTWPGCIVSPYLMVQCADARHWGRICDHVYRFCAMDLSADERKTIHGNNERIRLDAITRTVEFYIRLMKQC